MKRIEITIDEAGDVSLETFGYSGSECEKDTRAIENGLGVAGDRKRKPEYFGVQTGQRRFERNGQ